MGRTETPHSPSCRNPLAQAGFAYGRDMLQSNVARYAPGASALWESLRCVELKWYAMGWRARYVMHRRCRDHGGLPLAYAVCPIHHDHNRSSLQVLFRGEQQLREGQDPEAAVPIRCETVVSNGGVGIRSVIFVGGGRPGVRAARPRRQRARPVHPNHGLHHVRPRVRAAEGDEDEVHAGGARHDVEVRTPLPDCSQASFNRCWVADIIPSGSMLNESSLTRVLSVISPCARSICSTALGLAALEVVLLRAAMYALAVDAAGWVSCSCRLRGHVPNDALKRLSLHRRLECPPDLKHALTACSRASTCSSTW